VVVDEPVADWTMALLPGQDVTALHPIEAVMSAVVDERTEANVYVVGSGGDGVYATYVGRTEDGRIAGFVTDFRVIPLR
jgi:uncharacterized protein DUF4241